MRKHPHLNPIFPTTLPISNNIFNIQPEHSSNNPFPLNNQTIHSQSTTHSFDQYLSSSSNNDPANIDEIAILADIARMKNISPFLSIELIQKEVPSLHSQEQSISRTLRFDFFEFNFFNLNIRIGFFEQLHPNIYVLIRIKE